MNILITKTVSAKFNDSCTINFEFFLQRNGNTWMEPLYKSENYTCVDQQALVELTESAKLYAQYLGKINEEITEMSDSEFYILFEKMPEIHSKKDFNYTLKTIREKHRAA
ncbi:hypothetical protein [Flammeovirga sp. OC4]|uniref:hypothetical protein n=1 Tax=Flammeovirga sp. OC4 TaxID=1382345 RepID=UPI0005C64308|nr:hypothetical protein [Flammeovirga sp. OC4]